jgi:hypothetical protein
MEYRPTPAHIWARCQFFRFNRCEWLLRLASCRACHSQIRLAAFVGGQEPGRRLWWSAELSCCRELAERGLRRVHRGLIWSSSSSKLELIWFAHRTEKGWTTNFVTKSSTKRAKQVPRCPACFQGFRCTASFGGHLIPRVALREECWWIHDYRVSVCLGSPRWFDQLPSWKTRARPRRTRRRIRCPTSSTLTLQTS